MVMLSLLKSNTKYVDVKFMGFNVQITRSKLKKINSKCNEHLSFCFVTILYINVTGSHE